MQNYEIRADLNDQRHAYLKVLLGVTLALVIMWSGLFLVKNVEDKPFWGVLLAGLVLSNEFRRRQHTTAASWIYIASVLATLGWMLIQNGPTNTIYVLFLLPIIAGVLLFESVWVVWLTVFCIGLMYVLTALQTNVFTAIPYVFVPALVSGGVAGVLSTITNATRETVYWATDIQRKDSRRAEMFYEQKEQLSEALRELSHTNSKLELLNVKLADAQAKTERVSKAKSVFLSNMSHELRTPLNVIIGYTSTMLDMPAMYNDIPLPEAYYSDVKLIKDNGYYLLGLINDILDLSKIEAGKLELHCTPVYLPEVFKGIIATSIGLVKDKPIQIRPDFSGDLPIVWGDPTRVRQIILNLMSNAIKFTHSGSVTLHAHVEGERVRISVIDTGIGIPEKALKHIFDRFQQAESDTDKHYGGTGLGLDISKQLAEMQGGQITVESVVGQGSIFSFTLPVHSEQQMEIPTVDEPIVETATDTLPEITSALASTILVIEDETSLREIMRRTLENSEYVVVDLPDGTQAFDMALGLLPELIVLDIRLPNIDGWEILQRLKSNPETAPIPVIVCTVSDDQDHAKQLGAELYLQKPFSPDELLACVEGLLTSSPKPEKGN